MWPTCVYARHSSPVKLVQQKSIYFDIWPKIRCHKNAINNNGFSSSFLLQAVLPSCYKKKWHNWISTSLSWASLYYFLYSFPGSVLLCCFTTLFVCTYCTKYTFFKVRLQLHSVCQAQCCCAAALLLFFSSLIASHVFVGGKQLAQCLFPLLICCCCCCSAGDRCESVWELLSCYLPLIHWYSSQVSWH